MKINRRTFLRGSSILLGGFIFQGNNVLPIMGEANNLRKIRNSVGVFNEKGGTIGWYLNGETNIVIDSQFPDTAAHFKTELNSLTSGKINYLFNTHHHNDHTMGNSYLKEFSENIVAHVNCPRLQVKQNKGKEAEQKIVTANLTFENSLNIELPKENISAKYFGKAHTGGDIVVHFENANIVHLGDLVFNNVYPYIDNNAEGSVENWIVVLEMIEKNFDNDTIFIFGHAESNASTTGTMKDVIRKRNYLEALFLHVKNEQKIGKSIEEIKNLNSIPGFDDLTELWDGAKTMNLGSMAEQLMK